ncbi:MAG: DUF58 domain-containing protein [Planctomycetes bacterium]|nr:DUF58 domain-containing protein [Planctomycetota bacterium]
MAVQRIPADELCDARFLASLEHLRVVAKRVAPRGRFAEQRSRDKGSGIEFKDYRPYSAGDDLRGIDWNVYRRLGRVFLRLFEELEDLPLYVLPDISRSAYLETPPRARAGLRCALAMAAISLGQHDRVGVFPFADDLSVLLRPTGGKGRVLELARRLGEIEPGGETDFERSLATFRGLRLREGLVCVVSDFFDPRGIEAVTSALGKLQHRLLLVRLVRQSDARPELAGDVRLVDCESGDVSDVSITSEVLARYRAAYAQFVEHLANFARSRGAGLLDLDVERDVIAQLERLFASGAYTA